MMTCGRARRLLWPDSGPREATAEIVAAREHLSDCPLCQRFLDEMRRIRERIGQTMPRPEAPVEVRDRLFRAIARARTEGPGRVTARRHWRWASAVAAGLLAGGAWLGLRLGQNHTPSPADAVRAVAEDHVRAQRNSGLTSSDSLEVARWLAERLPFAIDIPIFPGAELKGARLLLSRQSGAVVEYAIAGRSLSYYILPAPDEGSPAPTHDVRLVPRAGYQIAMWDDAGLTHALVAGLPPARLVELAHYCIAQMRAVPA